MPSLQSDALVFFGATGDLAYKQIFPSIQRLIRDQGLNVPIIGSQIGLVARPASCSRQG
jgi:glucose-6-phosphate 1-dehydrogenase